MRLQPLPHTHIGLVHVTRKKQFIVQFLHDSVINYNSVTGRVLAPFHSLDGVAGCQSF